MAQVSYIPSEIYTGIGDMTNILPSTTQMVDREMNIKTAQSIFNKAVRAQKAGQNLLAARLFFVAQRDAKQCRSAKRIRIMDCAHAGAVMNSTAVLKSDAGHSAKSEAGRIKAESYNSYRAGI